MTGDDRKLLRRGRDLVKGTRKLLRIHRDVLDTAHTEQLIGASDNLAATVAAKNASEAGTLGDSLEETLNRVFPRPSNASLRENVEVLLVALIVAMAVRTFFVQPFKIPTGSMQPTLYGIVEDPDCDPNAPLLKRFSDSFAAGRWPTTPRGSLFQGLVDFAAWIGFGHWPAGGRCLMRGDHIFVDKLSYHFRRPKRGEVIVFDTRHVPSPRGKFYIKRLICLDGDTVQVQPPYVLVNGEILDDQPIFQRIYAREDGYSGYVIPEGPATPEYLKSPSSIYQVRAGYLFVMGDNSLSSYDGRFWGDFPRTDLVGRAVVVYWPFSSRWGPID